MDRTVGVEEEFLLFRSRSASLAAAGEEVVAAAAQVSGGSFEHELKREQAELGTAPHQTTTDLLAELEVRRAELAEGAAVRGLRLAAVATSPLDQEGSLTPDDRYRRMIDLYGRVARLQLTCGMHVHVAVNSPEEGVRVIDRIGPWLPVLLALSANSPYFAGEDTGYCSYRNLLWNHWPTAGPTGTFGDLAAYHRARDELLATGAAIDDGMIYFDARLSARYPTVEIRVADVCPYADDAATLAALARALVDTAAEDGLPAFDVTREVLRSATWRAARFGIEGDLYDVASGRLVGGWDLAERLVDLVATALDGTGDHDLVQDGLQRIRRRGTGARLQREAFGQRHDFADVIAAVAEATTSWS